MMNYLRPLNRLVGGRWHLPAVLALVLVASSFYSYLLFHTLLELTTVLIATSALVVTWQAYASVRNPYLTLLGCGYFWIGMLDFAHALAYRGMHVLPSVVTANEPTQLWIAARYSEALLLLLVPLFVARPIRRDWTFALFGLVAVALLSLIMSGNFPDCFIDGNGLTPFKIYSEYLIIFLLAGAMTNLWRHRALIDKAIVAGILLANVFTVGAEFSFTQYASVYGPANLIGHVFKLFAFWMIYAVLVEFAFRRPESAPQADANANRPVHRAFWPLAALSVLAPLLMFGTVAWQGYQTTMHEAQRDVARSTEVFYSHALNVFQTNELIAESVNFRIKGMSWDEIEHSGAIRDYLKIFRGRFPQAQAIWLVDSTGRIRNASEQLPASLVNVADRDYFKTLRERDVGIAVGELVQARIMKGWNFNLAQRRSDSAGRFDGVVVVTLFENYFSDFWNHGVTGSDSVVALVRGDGKFLARSPRVEPTALSLPPSASLMVAKQNADQGAYRGVSTTDGVERLYAFHKLPKYDVTLVYGLSVDTALAGWKSDLLTYSALFGTAALALLMLSLLTLRTAHQAEVRERNAMLEQRVLARTADLQAANQELEAFTYSASHDLRAPLRSIDGFSRMLEEDYAERLDADGKDALHRVRAAAQRMAELIDSLLNLSRLARSDMRPEVVDLSALARAIVEALQAGEPARSVVFAIPAKLEVRGDRRLLTVLLENLLGNAWKFTSKRPGAHVELGAIDRGGKPAYFVRDDGAGFDMANVANLFIPFQRLHSAGDFPGTGIGLATVRRIAQRHGGRTWAEGAVDRGATLYFTLSD